MMFATAQVPDNEPRRMYRVERPSADLRPIMRANWGIYEIRSHARSALCLVSMHLDVVRAARRGRCARGESGGLQYHDMANCPVEGSDKFLHLSCVMDDMMSIVYVCTCV